MPLTPGQTLSYYEILAPLGAGAMGEVYRARDSRLHRDVAIKVLPEHFADDDERLQRFEREARTLASVNHPNVAQIFGVDQVDDTCFLVLELVEGEALEDRLARGALPVQEALDVCRQIASGLEAAHEAGVIHRDLKPANVRLTPDGKAKVLDFGLAKPTVPGDEGSSTDSVLATEAGRLLGTPTHMAPEQARGKPIDRRVDVWAFGCVLYECLTGRRTFDGESLSDVLAAVLEREPNWSALPAGVPPRVRRLLERCLTKDPYERLRDIGDARLELVDALARRGETEPTTITAERPRATLAWSVAAVAAAVALWLAFGAASSAPPQRGEQSELGGSASDPGDRTRRLSIDLPPDVTVLTRGNFAFDLSADGRFVVFYALRSTDKEASGSFDESPKPQLFVRALDSYACIPLAGTERASGPFFSPDAEWIAYFDNEANKLRKIPRSGGAPVDLCDCPSSSRGGDWSANGTIVFTRGMSGGLYTVSDTGGEPKPLAVPDWSKGEKSYRQPAFLPGGTHVLATRSSSTLTNYDDADIVRISVATGDVETVLRGGETPRYARSGHLLFGRAGGVHAVSYDLATGRTLGAPFLVQDDVVTSDSDGTAQFALSDGGTLVVLPGGPEQVYTEFAWIDAEGHAGERLGLEPALHYDSRVSPDGTRLAIQTGAGNDFVQVHDLVRNVTTRLVSGGWDCSTPVWSADGERVIFSSGQKGAWNLVRQRADGSEPPEMLLESTSSKRATGTTPDGRFVVYTDLDIGSRRNVMLLPIDEEGRAGEPQPLLVEPFAELEAVVSPDGKWVAYASDESGPQEVYVRPFPDGTRRWLVSRDGGARPGWSRDGKRLFFLSREGLLEVDLSNGPGPNLTPHLRHAWGEWIDLHVVESDEFGERLLGLRTVERVRRTRLDVVLDVFAELGRAR